MNLCTYQTTNRYGTVGEKMVPLSEAVVKPSLLLINVLLGWIFANLGGERRRIFNRASNTIVIKTMTSVGSSDRKIRCIKDGNINY
jgi:hypothetical protein